VPRAGAGVALLAVSVRYQPLRCNVRASPISTDCVQAARSVDAGEKAPAAAAPPGPPAGSSRSCPSVPKRLLPQPAGRSLSAEEKSPLVSRLGPSGEVLTRMAAHQVLPAT